MEPGSQPVPAVAAIAARVLGLPVTAIERTMRIKGGLTNESWLVVAEGQQIVIRISTGDEQALQINRVSESRVLAAVEHAGIGAEILLCSPEERLLVTRYIPGRIWTQEEAAHPDNIRRVAILLKRLHSMEPPQGVARTDLPGILEGYWRTLEERNHADPEGGWNRDELREVARAFSDGAVHCLCHNDVHHLNLVDAGRLWLLDWEYAGIGDPCFDLASVCCYHHYGKEQRRQLLLDYSGHDDCAAYARLELACWLFDYIRQLWLVVRADKP